MRQSSPKVCALKSELAARTNGAKASGIGINRLNKEIFTPLKIPARDKRLRSIASRIAKT
jgi:hypothetical protein